MPRRWVWFVLLGGVLGLAHGSSAGPISPEYFGSGDQLIDFQTPDQQTTTVATGTPEQTTFINEGSDTDRPWNESDIPGPASNPTPINGTILRANVFVSDSTRPPFTNPRFSDIGLRFLSPRLAFGIDLLQIASNIFQTPQTVQSVTIELLGVGGESLEEITQQINGEFTFFGWEDERGITEVLIAGATPGLVGIDDVRIGDVIAGGNGPEPGALMLLLVGAGALALRRRAAEPRRRRVGGRLAEPHSSQ